MFYFGELITLAGLLKKEKVLSKGLLKKRVLLGGPRVKSLAALSNDATYFFPVVASENLTSDEVVMIMRAVERSYAMFARTAFMLIPAITVDDFNDATVKDYLRKFHTNLGVKNNFSMEFHMESSNDFNHGVLNENNRVRGRVTSAGRFGDSRADNESDKGSSGRERRFIDADWKKANDLMPTSMTIPVKFISGTEGNTTSHTVEIPVNIKATMHRADTDQLVSSMVDATMKKKGFLNFVRYISGEEKSASDLLFGISQIKSELLNSRTNPWLAAFKRRKRLADISWSILKDNFKPIATVVLTMNEVNTLKNRYNIDIFKDAAKVMKEYYLLGFIIADQVNEVIHVQFDSQPGFQEYPYKTLEREAANQDRVVRDLVKNLGAFR